VSDLKGGFWANTVGPGASFTHLGPQPQSPPKLDDNLGTAGISNLHGHRIYKQEEEGCYPTESLYSSNVMKYEMRMGYARFKVRNNQIKSESARYTGLGSAAFTLA
jgi:hypothetical protein